MLIKTSDPCEEANRLILHVSGDRSTRCRDKSLRHCDSKLQQNWYRPMMGSADVKMATSCVERDSCGTESPIWLNGKKGSLSTCTMCLPPQMYYKCEIFK